MGGEPYQLKGQEMSIWDRRLNPYDLPLSAGVTQAKFQD